VILTKYKLLVLGITFFSLFFLQCTMIQYNLSF